MTNNADEIISDLESRGLGWSLDHSRRTIEARIWKWPNVVASYRPESVVPLGEMLAGAYSNLNLRAHPIKEPK